MASDAWITRWENLIEQGRLDELGPKGREYYEMHYGSDVPDEYWPPEYDDYLYDYWDMEEEY